MSFHGPSRFLCHSDLVDLFLLLLFFLMPFNLSRSCININAIGLFFFSLSVFNGSDNYFLHRHWIACHKVIISYLSLFFCHFCLQSSSDRPLSSGSENDSGLPWNSFTWHSWVTMAAGDRGRGFSWSFRCIYFHTIPNPYVSVSLSPSLASHSKFNYENEDLHTRPYPIRTRNQTAIPALRNTQTHPHINTHTSYIAISLSPSHSLPILAFRFWNHYTRTHTYSLTHTHETPSYSTTLSY